jgi:hypothetical protein
MEDLEYIPEDCLQIVPRFCKADFLRKAFVHAMVPSRATQGRQVPR